MNLYEKVLSPFIGLIVLEIDKSGNVLKVVLDTRHYLNKTPPDTIYQIFSKEEKFRLNRVLELGNGERKKFMELNSKYAKDEYVDVVVDWSEDNHLYMFLQFFESNKEREISFDRYIEKLANLSERDSLTNVLNRNGFWEYVKKLLLLSDPEKRIGIVYIDVDGLKKINDQYGHNAGDRTILEISGTILSSLRQRDIVTRVGGDEFIVVVEELSGKKSTAYGLAKRLLRDIAEKKGKTSTTISVGVHVTKAGAFSKYLKKEENLKKAWDKTIKQADQAMYISKKAGGNRISVSNEYSKYY